MLSFPEFLLLIVLCSYRIVSATDYYDRITTQIDTNFKLKRGDRLYSQAGDTYLHMQTDGNCLLKDENDQGIWDTGTGSGEGDYLALKQNGNLRIMNAQNIMVWETGTAGNAETQPHSLVVYYHCVYLKDKDFTVSWSAGSGCSAPYPTFAPTPAPIPTMSPTVHPTPSPTSYPTPSPTYPTQFPSKQPTLSPTPSPTFIPTQSPTEAPTESPSKSPSNYPTNQPSHVPTRYPTKSPTNNPTQTPTDSASFPTTLIQSSTSSPTQQSLTATITSIVLWVMCVMLFVAVIVTLILFTKYRKHQAKQNDMTLKREIQDDVDDKVYSVEQSYDKKRKNDDSERIKVDTNRKSTNAMEEGQHDDNRNISIQRDESGESDAMYIEEKVEEVVIKLQNTNDSDEVEIAQNKKQEKTKDDEYYDKHYDEIRKAELNE